MGKLLPPGKLDWDVLRLLLREVSRSDRVVVGPRIGEDAAAIDMGDVYLVVSSDPVTLADERAGWYMVHVNANDVATMGAEPKWLLATLLLPAGAATEEMARDIVGEITEACAEVGCDLCGGHTEVTEGLVRPILVGAMIGEVARDRLVTSSGARPGDVILLTKAIAVEGTAILGRAAAARLAAEGEETLAERAAGYLDDPGISVVRDALGAVSAGRPSAMHDPTEGGLATGLHELAEASGVGVLVERERIPVLPECERICRMLSLDPMGLIASGALLITSPEDDAAKIGDALRASGIAVCAVGRVVDRREGVTIVEDGRRRPLPRYEQDEIVRALRELGR